MIGSLPLWPIYGCYDTNLAPFSWLERYSFGPFYGWKLIMWPVLSLVSYQYEPFMVGNLPLWTVFQL